MIGLDIQIVTDSVNRGTSTAEGRMQACTIGLSINEYSKLEKGKEKNSNCISTVQFGWLNQPLSHDFTGGQPVRSAACG